MAPFVWVIIPKRWMPVRRPRIWPRRAFRSVWVKRLRRVTGESPFRRTSRGDGFLDRRPSPVRNGKGGLLSSAFLAAEAS